MILSKELKMDDYHLVISIQSKDAYFHSMMTDNREELEQALFRIQKELSDLLNLKVTQHRKRYLRNGGE